MTSKQLIRFDYAMKKLLRNKANFDILEGFIEVFLGKKCKIQSILESEGNQNDIEDKFNRVDIKAQDEDGEIFIVEVQTTRYTYFLERLLYGVSKAIVEQLDAGDIYGKIRKVYSISIVYYDFGEGEDYLYEINNDFIGVNKHDKLKITRKEELTFAEIAKGDQRKFKYKTLEVGELFPKYYIIRVKAFKNVVKTALDEWMSFLKDNSIKDNTTVPGLVEAKKKLLYDQMSEKEKRSYLNHIESVFGEEDATTYARAEGKVEGKLEGIAEGLEKGRNEERAKAYQEKIEMAKKMKAMNMTIEQISIVTGLSIDEIKKI